MPVSQGDSALLSQHKHTEVFIRPGPGPHTNTVHSHRSQPDIILPQINENIAVKLCGQIFLLIFWMKGAFLHCILGHYRNNHVLYLSHRITSESCMVTILSSFNSGDLCSYSPSSQKTDTKTSTSKPSSAPAVCKFLVTPAPTAQCCAVSQWCRVNCWCSCV